MKALAAMYGRLRVLGPSRTRPYMVEVQCSCGTMKEVYRYSLTRGLTTSCGCFSREAAHRATHGMSDTPEYEIWIRMRARCSDAACNDYKDYGARGITVCERWEKFENFLEDMGRRPSPEHSLDRRDNNLGYSKDNCRWATRVEQANNRRSNRVVELGGEKLTLAEWSRRSGVPYATLFSRLKAGWPAARALSQEVRRGNYR